MPKKDFAQLALSIVQKATGTAPATSNGTGRGIEGRIENFG
ncbi:MAG: hypothetical protein WAO00_08960 [Chthoniobacterales bacterium]